MGNLITHGEDMIPVPRSLLRRVASVLMILVAAIVVRRVYPEDVDYIAGIKNEVLALLEA